jgi:hypothetical protein
MAGKLRPRSLADSLSCIESFWHTLKVELIHRHLQPASGGIHPSATSARWNTSASIPLSLNHGSAEPREDQIEPPPTSTVIADGQRK